MDFEKAIKTITVATAIFVAAIGALTYFYPSSVPKMTAISELTKTAPVLNALNNSGTINQDNSTRNTVNNFGPKEPDPRSRDGARKTLHDDSLQFSTTGFEQAAESDEPDVVDLYLRAGMSPNALSSGSLFILTMAIANNPQNINGIIDAFKKHGLDFQIVNPKNVQNGKHQTMEEELFDYSILRGRSDIVRHLIALGADPSFLTRYYQQSCLQIQAAYRQAREAEGQRRMGQMLGPFNTVSFAETQRGYLDQKLLVLKAGGVATGGCPRP